MLQRIGLTYLLAVLVVLTRWPAPDKRPKSPAPGQTQQRKSSSAAHGCWSVHAQCMREHSPWWLIGSSIFACYCILCSLPVPGCSPVHAPGCNMAGYVDALVLRPQHMYPYPTCRRVSTLMTVVRPAGPLLTDSPAHRQLHPASTSTQRGCSQRWGARQRQ